MARNPFEFTAEQNFWTHLREDGSFLWFKWKGYRLPYSDTNIATRTLDETKVSKLTDEAAFGPQHNNVKVGMPKDQSTWKKQWNNASGQPMQAGDPNKTITVKVLEREWVNGRPVYPGKVEYEVDVPAPKAGYLWIQDNPQPVKNLSGWADQHARILNPDGSSTEMIGATPKKSGGRHVSVEVRGLGRYDAEGNLTDPRDRHVTAWKEETEQEVPATRVSPLILGRFENPHRLAISVPGADAPDTMHEIGLWVALPYDSVPWEELAPYPDATRVAEMLVTHGAITMDHGQQGSIIEQTGADWKNVNFGGWAPTYDQFRKVES